MTSKLLTYYSPKITNLRYFSVSRIVSWLEQTRGLRFHLWLADFWFWTSKVASWTMGSPRRLPYWRHIWVRPDPAVSMLCFLHSFFHFHMFLTFGASVSWTGFQVFGPRVFYAWDCWWKDRCFRVWGSTIRAHNRSPCSWFISPEPGDLGMIWLCKTQVNFHKICIQSMHAMFICRVQQKLFFSLNERKLHHFVRLMIRFKAGTLCA